MSVYTDFGTALRRFEVLLLCTRNYDRAEVSDDVGGLHPKMKTMVGHPTIFDDVSGIWRGPQTSPEDIKRTLAKYVKRRNQIAHEGDRETSGAVRPMQPAYANNCTDFIENLVFRLNRVAYGV